MRGFFARGQKKPKPSYDVHRLIDLRDSPLKSGDGARSILVCDIDKTYVETEFETWLDMAKLAIEDADDKVGVRGASDFLRLYRWGSQAQADQAGPRTLYFISSSPPQLRRVLEGKLHLDGLDWDSLVLKNQLYNLQQRRYDLLRQHVAYKLLAIIACLQRHQAGASLSLVGDFAELDAFIYLVVNLLGEGRLGSAALTKVLEQTGVDAGSIAGIVEAAGQLPRFSTGRIFIRNIPGYRKRFHLPLTSQVWVFEHFLHVASAGFLSSMIGEQELAHMIKLFHHRYRFHLRAVIEDCFHNAAANGASNEELERFIAFCRKAPFGAGICDRLDLKSAPQPSRSSIADAAALNEAELVDALGEFYLALTASRRFKDSAASR